MSSLPHDIIVDILRRVPVKHLLRLRCVSKSWRKLIDGSDFISLHLRHSNTSNSFLLLKHSENLFWASLASLESASRIDQPLMCYNHCVKVIGCCNGLVCIRNIVDDVAFWNPSTRKYRVVPFMSLDKRRRYSGNSVCFVCVYGFGYDPVHDDYKLVRVAQFGSLENVNRRFETEVMVFSLVRDQWRRIGDIDYAFRYRANNGVFACGCLHWVVSRNSEVKVYDVVVALDLAVDGCKEVELPEFGDRGGARDFGVELGTLEGCFCVVLNYLDVCSDVWVMKEYGVRDSWSKLFSLMPDQVGRYHVSVRVLGYANVSDEILCQGGKSKLFVYEMKRKSAKNVKIHRVPGLFKANVCVQSLVSFSMYDGKKRVLAEKKNVKKR